ncbi:MAG: GNAT family protein [Longimicrobiales bacterium]
MNINAARLTLIGATIPALEADLAGRAQLSAALGVPVPDNWPPELYDAPAIEWTLNRLRNRTGPDDGLGMYYIVLRDGSSSVLVGVGGAGISEEAGPGVVEIGYGVLPQFQRRGYATETVASFLSLAFAIDNVTRVIAQTMPDLIASIRVLEKNGFRLRGEGFEESAILYEVTRDHYGSSSDAIGVTGT